MPAFGSVSEHGSCTHADKEGVGGDQRSGGMMSKTRYHKSIKQSKSRQSTHTETHTEGPRTPTEGWRTGASNLTRKRDCGIAR